MKKLLIAVLCTALLGCAWGASKKNNIKWGDDISAVQKTLKGKKRCILVFFTAPAWCGPCRSLEKGAIASSKFAKIAKDNAVVRFDFSDRKNVSPEANKQLKRFKVSGFPTLIVLDYAAREKGRIVGYRPENIFFKDLKKLMK